MAIRYDYNGNPIEEGYQGDTSANTGNTTQTQATPTKEGKVETQEVQLGDGTSYTYIPSKGGYYDSRTGARVSDPTTIGSLDQRRGGPTRPTTGQPDVAGVGVVRPGANPFGEGGGQVGPGSAGRDFTGGGANAQDAYGVNPDRVPDPRNGGQGGQQGQPGVGDASAFNQYLRNLGISAPDVGFDFASYLGPAEQVFRQELDRLAQSDPFGNQAFLQKATDRAIGGAAAVAAGARGGAGAVGGAFRQAQGVQSQLAAQGAQEMAEQKAQDERQAQQGRLAAASGLGQLAATGAQAGIEQERTGVAAFEAGISAALQFEGLTQNERRGLEQMDLAYKQMDQQERSMLLSAAAEFQKIDAALYQTDKNYQAQVDSNIIQKYGIDKQFQLGMEQIKAQGKLTFKDVLLGTINAGAQATAAVVSKSDRRAKYDVKDPDMDEIKDFLAKSKGYSYKYKDQKDGKGTNWGPMAQGLKASKMGKSTVVEKGGELYVDTGRLALVDHAVLAELHATVEALKKDLK